MSARRMTALLVVVMLGLLLVSPSALSRPDARPTSARSWLEDAGTPGDEDDEPDDIPNGDVDGDDDNWDRPAGHGHTVAEPLHTGEGLGEEVGTDRPVETLSKAEIGYSVRLTLLLRIWVIALGVR